MAAAPDIQGGSAASGVLYGRLGLGTRTREEKGGAIVFCGKF